MRIVCTICFVFFLFACKKNNDSSSNQLNGLYRGTFNRTGMDTAQVNIIFQNNNRFEGTGGPLNYPSICAGSFQQSSNSLVVDDTCTWTANFDWTLIFDGSYNINYTGGNSVRIWRTNGAVTDEYLLNKITR
jgi:hypothetical protein